MDGNVGVGFGIFHFPVIGGPQLLDEMTFQQKRLKFRICMADLQIPDMGNQHTGFGAVAAALDEIGLDPAPELFGFTYIDNVAQRILHEINAGG
ncbi:hypothetical protein D3C76_1281690 [compost metagenome]